MGFSDPTKDKATEEQLVKDLQAGEMGSFEQLANLYQGKIYSLSFNLTRNATDSQDVTQEVLLTLFRKWHTFQGKSAFSSWVYRITLNASYMKLRSRKESRTFQLTIFSLRSIKLASSRKKSKTGLKTPSLFFSIMKHEKLFKKQLIYYQTKKKSFLYFEM